MAPVNSTEPQEGGVWGGSACPEDAVLFEGALNRISLIRHRGQPAVLRQRIHPELFRYEPGIAKEAYVAAFLGQPAGISDAERAAGVAALQAPVDIPSGVKLLAFAHDPAGPWSIQAAAAGESLLFYPQPSAYRTLGGIMARLHECRFEGFHAALTDIGHKPPLGWAQHLGAALQKELPEARRWAPSSLEPALNALRLEDLPAPPAVLVHNDLHGDNILIQRDDGSLILLDWDNAAIDAPELDFVKLRHWTRLRPPGLFSPDEALWQAAVDGYIDAGGTPPDPLRLALYEVLWLMRLGNFEAARGTAPPPFRPLGDVKQALEVALKALEEKQGGPYSVPLGPPN